MKRNIRWILCVWGALLFLAAILGKASVAADNGRAAADFLNIGVGAKAAAMGGAYSSVADDATAAYWNPAGLAAVPGAEISFSHFTWYQDLTLDYLALAFPLSERLTIAASADYLSYGTIEGYDADDNPLGDVGTTYDFAGGIAMGYQVTDKIALGLGAKYIMTSLAGTRGTALAADLGLRYDLSKFSFGLAASNFGQNLKLDQESNKLPASLRLGIGYRPFGPTVLVAAEYENQLYGNTIIKNGLEFNYHERYFVRFGYSLFPEQEDRSLGQSLTFGVGAILGISTFDYSFAPRESISSEDIHRLTLTLHLGGAPFRSDSKK